MTLALITDAKTAPKAGTTIRLQALRAKPARLAVMKMSRVQTPKSAKHANGTLTQPVKPSHFVFHVRMRPLLLRRAVPKSVLFALLAGAE